VVGGGGDRLLGGLQHGYEPAGELVAAGQQAQSIHRLRRPGQQRGQLPLRLVEAPDLEQRPGPLQLVGHQMSLRFLR
jgi:hypothetical protein